MLLCVVSCDCLIQLIDLVNYRGNFYSLRIHDFKESTTRDSTYLPRILETHPLLTCSMRDMSHGLAPLWASSTIFCLVESGSGRPLT